MIVVAVGCLDRWMTVADGMGLQGMFLQWLVVAGYVVVDLYLQCLCHNTYQTLANVLQ